MGVWVRPAQLKQASAEASFKCKEQIFDLEALAEIARANKTVGR